MTYEPIENARIIVGQSGRKVSAPQEQRGEERDLNRGNFISPAKHNGRAKGQRVAGLI